MGLRGKLRQTFSSSSKKSASTSSASSKNNNNKNNASTSNTPSIYPNETHYTDRTDIEYYKPNEIPKSKYRGKVDPAHHASLGAFSLSDAFAATTRRASLALSGTFSPGGTKSQSRVPSRRPSVVAVPDAGAGSNLRIEERAGSGGSEATRERSEDSNNSSSSSAGASAGEGIGSDTASTSLSGPTSTTGTTAPTTAVAPTPMTALTSPSNPKLTAVVSDSGLDAEDLASSTVLSKQITAHDTPFTAEELEMAMTRATFRDRDGVVREVHVA